MATIDPLTRTHKNPDDIVWNIIDIIDDYLIFQFLVDNPDIKNQMLQELTAYIGNLQA